MSHMIENNMLAYKGETPWHGLGVSVTAGMTGEQMLVAAQMNWRVQRRSLAMRGADGQGLISDKLSGFKATGTKLMVSKEQFNVLRHQMVVDRLEALYGLLAGVDEMALRADPASYVPDMLPLVWASVTREVVNNDPTLCLQRAGDLAAARLRNHMSKLVAGYEQVDDPSTLSPSDVLLYEAFYGDQNLWQVLADVSGSRTVAWDLEEPQAVRPMDAPMLEDVAAQRAAQRAEWEAKAREVEAQREARLVAAKAKQDAFREEQRQAKARADAEEQARQKQFAWYRANGVYFGGRASTMEEMKARAASLLESKRYAVQQAQKAGKPVPAEVLADVA